MSVVAGLLVSTPKESKRKGHHIVGRFFAIHALGLSASMIEVINNTSSVPPPIQERKRYISAMEEMIVLGKEYIRAARPQVCLHRSSMVLRALTFVDFCVSFIRTCHR